MLSNRKKEIIKNKILQFLESDEPWSNFRVEQINDVDLLSILKEYHFSYYKNCSSHKQPKGESI